MSVTTMKNNPTKNKMLNHGHYYYDSIFQKLNRIHLVYLVIFKSIIYVDVCYTIINQLKVQYNYLIIKYQIVK